MSGTAKVLPDPIKFDSVAYIAFDGDRPVIMSSARIEILADTLFDVASRYTNGECGDDPDSDSSIFEAYVDREDMVSSARRFKWHLYLVNDAKQVWASYYDSHPQSAYQPSLFEEESC